MQKPSLFTGVLVIIVTCAIAILAASSPPSDNPAELGRVRWGRDFEAALLASRKSQKPVLLLFQEIPGCQGCKDFGAVALSHPLLVEAIESEFIPVAIHNNKPAPSKDAEVLKRFDEPAWNYPVARFLSSDAKDLIPRQDGVFNVSGLASRMIESLKAAGREVPNYLKIALAEARSQSDPAHRETATFAMHCFWEGEAYLGSIEGVITTKAGFVNDSEVVDVVYDPTTIAFKDLLLAADTTHCAATVYVHSDVQRAEGQSVLADRLKAASSKTRPAPESDQKVTLANSPHRFMPLTPMQVTKVNAALRRGRDVNIWLSPRQIALLERIKIALLHDPKSLDELERPEVIADLPKFEDRLNAALAKAGAKR